MPARCEQITDDILFSSFFFSICHFCFCVCIYVCVFLETSKQSGVSLSTCVTYTWMFPYFFSSEILSIFFFSTVFTQLGFYTIFSLIFIFIRFNILSFSSIPYFSLLLFLIISFLFYFKTFHFSVFPVTFILFSLCFPLVLKTFSIFIWYLKHFL